MHTTRLLVVCLLIFTVLFGMQYVHRTFGIGPDLRIPEAWLVKLGFSSDTERQKAAQQAVETPVPTAQPSPTPPSMGAVMTIPLVISSEGLTATASPSAARQEFLERVALIETLQPAGVILFGTGVSLTETQDAVAVVKRVAPNAVVMVDHEGGTVQRLSGEGFTTLASWRSLCGMTEAAMQAAVATTAAELNTAGVDVVLGPVVDLATGGFMGNRTCAASPQTVAARSNLVISEYEKQGIQSVLKHFPGIGSVGRDLHTASALATITDTDTESFARLLENRPDLATMVSFVRIAGVEENIPCALSQYCVAQLKKAYPESLVITDALEMVSAGVADEVLLARIRPTPEGVSNLASVHALGSPGSTSSASQPVATATAAATLSTAAQPTLTLSERSVAALEAGSELLLYGPSVTTNQLQEVAAALEARYTDAGIMTVRYDQAVAKIARWRAK